MTTMMIPLQWFEEPLYMLAYLFLSTLQMMATLEMDGYSLEA